MEGSLCVAFGRALSFGLINIPVKLYSATERKSVRFSFIHRACGTRVEYQMVPDVRLPGCTRKLPAPQIAPGQYVLRRMKSWHRCRQPSRNIEIVSFVSQQEIDPVYYDKSYFWNRAKAVQRPTVYSVPLYMLRQVMAAVLRRKELGHGAHLRSCQKRPRAY